MSLWNPGLHAGLVSGAEALGIQRLTSPEALDRARQTGFVWTRRPGVVCLAANRHYLRLALDNPDVVAIVTSAAVARDVDVHGRCLVVCEQPEQVYLRIHIDQPVDHGAARPRVEPGAQVDPTALLSGPVVVEAGAVIGPRVVLQGPVRIGAGAHVEAGAVLGCEGLFAKTVAGRRRHVPHFGGVDVGERAFVHAGAVIVRSAIAGENTVVGAETHVGIMANIGHDVTVGPRSTISSNVVVAGRARIGGDVWIGASATVSNEVRVGDGATIRIGAVVVRDVPAGGDVSSGNFARSHALAMRAFSRDSQHESR